MAELVAAHVDLDAVVRLAEPIPPGPAWDPSAELAEAAAVPSERGVGVRPTERRVRSAGRGHAACARSVAVGRGPAFTFGYAEHAELLAAAGCAVAVVDPLHDEALPVGTAALVLPGGFPEEHVAALSANAPLRAAVADLAASGAPLHAECGGLLYLCASLDGAPLCGVLPATAAMTGRLTLGYRDAVALAGSVPFAAGPARRRTRVPPLRGHPPGGCGAGVGLAGRRARGFRDGGRARLVPAHPPGRNAGGGRALRPRRCGRCARTAGARLTAQHSGT